MTFVANGNTIFLEGSTSDIIGQSTTHNSAMADNEKSERKTEKEQQQPVYCP